MTRTEPDDFTGMLRSLTDDGGRPLPMTPEERLASMQAGRRRRRLGQVAAAGVAAVALLVGGSVFRTMTGVAQTDPAGPPADAVTVVREAAATTKAAGTLRYDIAAVLAPREGGSPENERFTGSVDLRSGDEGGAVGTASRQMEYVRAQGRTYVRGAALLSLPRGKSWVQLDETGFPLGRSIVPLLDALPAGTEIRRVGAEERSGRSTVRFELLLTYGAVKSALDGDDSVDPSVRLVTNVWVGMDGRVQALRLPIAEASRFEGNEVPAPGASGKVTSYLTFEFSDYGTPVRVTAPPANQVLTAAEADALGPPPTVTTLSSPAPAVPPTPSATPSPTRR